MTSKHVFRVICRRSRWCKTWFAPNQTIIFADLVGVVTFNHVTKMATTPFYPPWRKTVCFTQTSRRYRLQNRSYCRSNFFYSRNAIFAWFCEKWGKFFMFAHSKECRLRGNTSFEVLSAKIGQTVRSVQVSNKVKKVTGVTKNGHGGRQLHAYVAPPSVGTLTKPVVLTNSVITTASHHIMLMTF